MLSMVTPRLAGIGLPSFCQVIVIGKSPETTTHGMKTLWPIENLGNSKGWIKGGTGRKRSKYVAQKSGNYKNYPKKIFHLQDN